MKTLLERDTEHVWHPFSIAPGMPVIPVRAARGTVLITEDGKEIIDAISSWWVNIHGHAHPAISAAVAAQLQKLHQVIFSGFTHEPAVAVSERVLSKLPPNQSKVFFSDNGSTAVEVALKQCIQYWKNRGSRRSRIIALENSYHGDTFGAMSAGCRSVFVEAFEDYLFEVSHLPALDERPDEAVRALEALLEKGDACCFIFEPLVQGAGGMCIHRRETLDELISLCRTAGVPCIADEVMTGFGRTGRWFASDYLSEKPDIFCLSKGLTGGTMAMSVTTCTEEIWAAFETAERSKKFFHGHSFTANPLACAAALASFEIMDAAETWERIGYISNHHAAFCAGLRNNPKAERVRHLGTIAAFDIPVPAGTGYLNPIRDRVMKYCLDRGVLIRPLGNVVYVLPPYCITDEELLKVYETVLAALEEVS